MGMKPGKISPTLQVSAVALLQMWSEGPMPQAPWAGLRKPGAGIVPPTSMMATWTAHGRIYFKSFLNGYMDSAYSWSHPLLIFMTCCTKAGSRIPRWSSIWKGVRQSPLYAMSVHHGTWHYLLQNRYPWVYLNITSLEFRVEPPRAFQKSTPSVHTPCNFLSNWVFKTG